MGITLTLDYASVLVFALTGALAASRAQLDIVGFIFFACLTAVGGGTLRDLLLDRDPVFWIADATPLAVAMAAAVVVFFTAHLMESRLKWLIWLDAGAFAIAVAAGVAVAREAGVSTGVVLVMGVATGTFGGLMRDVVANEVPLVLKQGELYVTAAFAGAAASLLGARFLSPEAAWPTVICIFVTFGLRAGSLLFGWSLPVYKGRPPRA
ncbi:trimeric intracellular cation channel family protein [Gymnodinialimonas ceratoperidinii]|uniref:Trimeric intracellular cation channel family protein n=1 Tax=Gymnodinialimonas ceratoperidinii TaxID=2856823 RepID=A0A8F6YAN4_9RHOB|nr:trimeric intracellular cation channel family protein [Gymnodinialimonas ceratoperidinii]QXT39728.1 trimeric intracellular cation channel family protein [Gymnodinialimonas ceratoperidinii]